MGGTYSIIITLPSATTIRFGALGERMLEPGGYAYVGSAFGPGGFARLDRHRRVDKGTNRTRHWHIDYLLGHDETHIVETITTPGLAAECRVADAVEGTPIDGVGASDCSCPSHLFYSADEAQLTSVIDAAHAAQS
jgi:endonuclease-3